MENNTFTPKSRTTLVVLLAVTLAFCMGFGIYASIVPNSLAFAASASYNLITDMPSTTSDGAGFTVAGNAVSGNTASITKHIADGEQVVVGSNIVNIGGVFGNFPLASLYYSTSASTNFSLQSGSFTITQPGTYYFVTIVDCYDSAAHSTISKSYRSTQVLAIYVMNTELPEAPSRVGYTFTGWYTDRECTQLYDKDTITEDIPLYPGFRPNNYTIVFHGNSNASGSMSNLVMKYDIAQNLPPNAFAKIGYSFDGWATSASGAVVYADEQSVTNLSLTDGATINLYAHWKADVSDEVLNAVDNVKNSSIAKPAIMILFAAIVVFFAVAFWRALASMGRRR